ncbi:MAG: S9 family peptidase [Opitutaceae bacterium]|jgi:dipeptidyl aminopeptidase/acylaminoacyl peptidase
MSARLSVGLLSVILPAALSAAVPPVVAPNPTIEELFRPALQDQVQLSPNGQFLGAICTNENDQQYLQIFDRTTGKTSDLGGGMSDDDISSFRWLSDDRLLYNVSKYKMDVVGLFATERKDPAKSIPLNVSDAVEVIGCPRSRPQNILVWIKQCRNGTFRDNDLVEIDTEPSLHSYGRPDIRYSIWFSGTLVRSYPPPRPDGTVVRWGADFDGELAFCIMYREKHFHLYRYQHTDQNWQEVPLDLDSFTLRDLDPDGRHLWVTHHDAKAGFVLQSYDVGSGRFEKPIWQDAVFDLADARLIFSRKNRRLAGLTYEQRRRINVWFEGPFADAQAAVDEGFPQCDNQLVGFDDKEQVFLFHTTGDRQPGLHLLFDRRKSALLIVAEAAPWLDGRRLATTQPISFRTRDGVNLEGYLTLPPEASKANPPALVVLPHGGPWERTTWTFDPEVQFLARLGYAVWQPNYRGSTGYAPAISHDRRFDFRRMHDDVTDATRALQRSGLIDPTRIAIMGGSFGGYLSLAGVAFEPDLYRCAVSLAGVFDWEELIEEKKQGEQVFAYQYLSDHLGAPGADHERFDEISPLGHAAQIRVPVFIAHGTEDTVVSARQSRLMADALEQNGVPHETFFRGFELHGFYQYADRVAYYRRVEAFLAKYLGPKTPLAPSTATK